MQDHAIVIGSGPNGLAAAIGLAEAGLPVTVLEQSDRPGGALRTEELTLPGYLHDTCSAVHPAAAASPVFTRLPLAGHGLEWVHPPVCLAHPLPDGSAVALHRSLQDTAASLDAVCAGDGARWAAFARPLIEGHRAVRALMLSGFPPLRGATALPAAVGPRPALRFAGALAGSASAVATRLFDGDGSRAWLYGCALHGDVPPHGAGSAIAGVHLALLGHVSGWPSPRGGAGRLAEALAAHARSLGVEIVCGARAERVTIRSGRARGVAVNGDRERPASIVIADVMPAALLTLTGDALRGAYRWAMARYRPGPATVKLDWALDGPIPWTAPEARQAGTVHVGGSATELAAAAERSAHELPARPFVLLGQQSLADRSRVPEGGGETAWAYAHGPARHAGELAAPRFIDAIEAQVERFAPGFRSLIRARRVLGPAALQALNPNLIDGDVGGGSYRMPQAALRPVPKLSPYRTPIEGLFIGSAATFPGGGVHGVCGDAAARAALRAR